MPKALLFRLTALAAFLLLAWRPWAQPPSDPDWSPRLILHVVDEPIWSAEDARA